jgi:peptidyl-prolyl cis-trans isomerase SurA
MRGEDFATLAVLYSEDPGSAKNSGELGFVKRNELVPEFAAEAFTLKGKEVSRVVETQFGFHIIQLIERRGEEVNVRHILLSPKTNSSDLLKAQLEVDSIRGLITAGKYTFAEAAQKFSDDKETKYNNGLMINPSTGTTRFEMDELDPQLFFIIDKMAVDEISNPVKLMGTDNKASYRIVQLKTRSTPHKANLKDDYQRVQQIALVQKQNKEVDKWIQKKVNTTYIRLDEQLANCKFTHSWKADEKTERIK